jgi:hypothetical protein
VFARLTGRQRLQDTEGCVNSQREKLYHMGFRGGVSRTTSGDVNAPGDSRIYQYFQRHLIDVTRELYVGEPLAVNPANTVYAVDLTTVDLYLSLCAWAHFHKTKAAIKNHTLLDLRGSIPAFIALTDGEVDDVCLLDVVPADTDAIVTMDRAYLDLARVGARDRIPAYFVLRAKRNLCFRSVDSRPVDNSTGPRADQATIRTG